MSDRFNSPITPSVGRIVLVRGSGVIVGEPMRDVPAIIERVFSDNCISAHVFNGAPGGNYMTSLLFDTEDDGVNVPHAVWRWMPYQVTLAQKVAAAANQVDQQTAAIAPAISVSTTSAEPSRLSRMREEHVQLVDKLGRLNEFLLGDKVMELDRDERLDLHTQFRAMSAYSDALGRRIARASA